MREMTRVVRSGGIVAVMEEDTLHQILLPWPVDLELAIRKAEWKAFQESSSDPKKYYIGRGLRALFEKCHLRPQQPLFYTFYRESPVGKAERRFLSCYFQNLKKRVQRRLSPKAADQLGSFLDPRSPSFLPHQPHFTLTYFEKIVWGKKGTSLFK